MYQNALRSLNIKKGDCVAGYLPNSIETLEAKLATLSMGAVWSCTSPDFGSNVNLMLQLVSYSIATPN